MKTNLITQYEKIFISKKNDVSGFTKKKILKKKNIDNVFLQFNCVDESFVNGRLEGFLSFFIALVLHQVLKFSETLHRFFLKSEKRQNQ